LLRSEDGGLTWSVAMNAQVNAVDFVDRTVGWVAGATTEGGHLFHTTNEGRSWTDEADTIAESTPLFFDVEALDRERAVAVGSENGFLHPSDFHRGPPVIVFTNNAGTAWQRSTLVGVDRGRFRDSELVSVCLTPSGHGIATGTDFTASSGSLVLLTHDAGATWTIASERFPSVLFAKVACAGDRDLWIAGGSGTLVHSPDAGASWRDDTALLPRDIWPAAITFQDPLDGWLVADRLVGDSLVTLHTTDGGQHWTEYEITGTTGLIELTVGVDFDGPNGVIVLQDLHPMSIGRSSFGVTFATRDGGETWMETVLPEGINAIWDVSLIR